VNGALLKIHYRTDRCRAELTIDRQRPTVSADCTGVAQQLLNGIHIITCGHFFTANATGEATRVIPRRFGTSQLGRSSLQYFTMI